MVVIISKYSNNIKYSLPGFKGYVFRKIYNTKSLIINELLVLQLQIEHAMLTCLNFEVL